MVASVPSMIGQFNMSNIHILLNLGYEVHVACNFYDRSVWTEERITKLKQEFDGLGVKYFQVDFSRSPIKLHKYKKAYLQLKKLLGENEYSFVHCHTPVASVICRIVTHYARIKCIYTAHGFHFFKGAPVINWLVYYPVEKILSRWTDVLITINKEDYKLAQKKMHAKKVVYIPGVGVDTKKFEICSVNREEKRKSLGIPKEAFVLLSVGELQERKNQNVVIEALRKLNNPNIYYLIVGKGELQDEYEESIKRYALESNIKLLGHRNDIGELCKISDCFIHPSVREGLGIALLEAMACGLPLISSYVNGIKDYTENNVSGCCIRNPLSTDEVAEAITKMFLNKELRKKCGISNLGTAKKFDIENTEEIMKELYMEKPITM